MGDMKIESRLRRGLGDTQEWTCLASSRQKQKCHQGQGLYEVLLWREQM
jgi:hypothetical protein